jgi:sulfate transport system substrate-binding protein
VDWLLTPAAQKIYAENGYRPVVSNAGGPSFPTPAQLFSINDLGGWSKVNKDLFATSDSVMAAVEGKLGIPTVPSPTPSK